MRLGLNKVCVFLSRDLYARVMTRFYAKTEKIHKLIFVEGDIHVLECGGVSSGGAVYKEITEEFSKCEVCFYDEFH